MHGKLHRDDKNLEGVISWISGLPASSSHWEELLQSVSDFIFSKHCGCTPRGVRGVKRPEILWEIQKYSLPGRPSSQNGVKSKTICHFLRNFDEFLNGFWFYSILAGWSTWQWVFLNFSQNFWSFDTHDTPGCASAVIWNHLKQIWAIPPTVSWSSTVMEH